MTKTNTFACTARNAKIQVSAVGFIFLASTSLLAAHMQKRIKASPSEVILMATIKSWQGISTAHTPVET